MEEDNQVAYAVQLADMMSGDGHEITYLDLLDYMAIAGLKFTVDTEGASTTAYQMDLVDPE